MIFTLSAVLLIAITFDFSPWLRGDNDWRSEYTPWMYQNEILLGLGAIIFYLTGSFFLWRQHKINWTFVVLWSFLGASLLPIAVQWLEASDPIEQILIRTSDPFIGGYQSVAIESEGAWQFLSEFTENAPNWNPHPQRHPPGIPLTFIWVKNFLSGMPQLTDWIANLFQQNRCDYWLLLFTSDAEFGTIVWGFAPQLLSALTVFPLLKLSKIYYSDRGVFITLIAYPLIPAVMVFGGMWDLPLTLITISSLLFFHRGFSESKPIQMLISGLILSIGLFISHASLVAIGFVGLYGLLLSWSEVGSRWSEWIRTIQYGLICLVGIMLPWLLYYFMIGDTYFDIYRVNTLPHFEMEANYWLRLFYNPYEFFLYAGFLLGGIGLISFYSAVKTSQYGRKPLRHDQALTISFWGVFLALVISGVSRAEVGRVWIFMMPLLLLSGISFFDRNTSGRPIKELAFLLLLAVQTIIIQVNLTPQDPFPHQFDPPNIMIQTQETLGNKIMLVGWEIHQSKFFPGEEIQVGLIWQALEKPDRSYTRFLHVYSENQGLIAQNDSQPVGGRYPTQCWISGEYIREDISITLGEDSQPGRYQLLLGMYDPENNFERLPTTGSGQTQSVVMLSDLILIESK